MSDPALNMPGRFYSQEPNATAKRLIRYFDMAQYDENDPQSLRGMRVFAYRMFPDFVEFILDLRR